MKKKPIQFDDVEFLNAIKKYYLIILPTEMD